MANRAYLLNTERLVTNPYLARDPRVAGRCVEVADWARSIPLPWILAFRPGDAKAFTHEWVEDEDDPRSERRAFAGLALSASKEKVLENLRSAARTMEQVAGDARLGRAYLGDAIRAFSGLELPFVMLNAEEIVDGDHRGLLAALDGSEGAVERLRTWAAIVPSPLEPDEPVPAVRDEAGLWCGFGPGFDAAAEDDEADEAAARDYRAAEAAALARLQAAAAAGDVGAQSRLAAHYAAEGSHRRAMEWLTRAAEGGDADAAFTLGRIFLGVDSGTDEGGLWRYAGPGVHAPRPEAAFAWVKRAVEAGCRDPKAFMILGEMAFDGLGTAQDHAAAVEWLEVAAEAGVDKAQLLMAIALYHGYGVGRDREGAARWALRAAEQGSAVAQFAMGLLCFQGHGVPRDSQAGRRWMEKAAAQGDENARTYLATPAWKAWARRGFFTGLR